MHTFTSVYLQSWKHSKLFIFAPIRPPFSPPSLLPISRLSDVGPGSQVDLGGPRESGGPTRWTNRNNLGSFRLLLAPMCVWGVFNYVQCMISMYTHMVWCVCFMFLVCVRCWAWRWRCVGWEKTERARLPRKAFAYSSSTSLSLLTSSSSSTSPTSSTSSTSCQHRQHHRQPHQGCHRRPLLRFVCIFYISLSNHHHCTAHVGGFFIEKNVLLHNARSSSERIHDHGIGKVRKVWCKQEQKNSHTMHSWSLEPSWAPIISLKPASNLGEKKIPFSAFSYIWTMHCQTTTQF